MLMAFWKIIMSNLSLHRMRWKARRGTLELDHLLRLFIDTHYGNLSDADKVLFSALLDHQDTQLEAWLIKRYEPIPDKFSRIARLILHTRIHR